jgi:ribonuclease P protein component
MEVMPLKVYRLKKREIKEVLKKGRRFYEKNLVLAIKENKKGKLRLGFVLGKKVSKKSVERNKIKRRLREILRKEVKGLELKKGKDLVFLPFSGLLKENFLTLKEKVEKILKKAEVIR